MTFLIIIAIAVIAFIAFRVTRNSSARNDYEGRSARQPLDPTLSEVFHRTAGDSDWRARSVAEDALRECTPHIYRLTSGAGQAPVLIVYQTTFNSYLAKGGLLVVTTDRTLLFADGRVNAVSHLSGVTTTIAGAGTQFWIDIKSADGTFAYACENLELARLICGAIDIWVDNPEVSYLPGAHVTPQRVQIPSDFYDDVLRGSRHPATPANVRALQERFGMLFIHYARKVIDSSMGLATGEQFTRDCGRPMDDRDLPQWPEQVLRTLIELRPDVGHTMGPFLPGRVHQILSEKYLACPERPLTMWMSDEYDHNGTGARRRGPRGALPPTPA